MQKKIKNSNVSRYDKKYFSKLCEHLNYKHIKNSYDISHIYRKAGSILNLDKDDGVVDFGCGAGHLSFFIS